MMNAIRYLLKGHEEVGKLFNQYVDAGKQTYWQKKFIAERVIEEISKHIELEEDILFPALKEKGGEEAEEIILEEIEGHQVTKFVMDRLKGAPPEDKVFDARFNVLMGVLKQHFIEEEHDLFPQAKKILAEDLERLGEQMYTLERQMRK